MLTFKYNGSNYNTSNTIFLTFCNLDARVERNCGGAADGAAAAQISRGPNPCRAVGTSVPPVSL